MDEKKRILIIIILYIFALEIKDFVLDMKSTWIILNALKKKRYRTELLRFRGTLLNLSRYRTNLRNLKQVY